MLCLPSQAIHVIHNSKSLLTQLVSDSTDSGEVSEDKEEDDAEIAQVVSTLNFLRNSKWNKNMIYTLLK